MNRHSACGYPFDVEIGRRSLQSKRLTLLMTTTAVSGERRIALLDMLLGSLAEPPPPDRTARARHPTRASPEDRPPN